MLISIQQATELLESAIENFLGMNTACGFETDEEFLPIEIELHAMIDVVIEQAKCGFIELSGACIFSKYFA